MDRVEVVLADNDRVTLRVGDTFLKVDADQRRTDAEVEAIGLAPVPTPQIVWHEPPVLALAALRGSTARPTRGTVDSIARCMGCDSIS